MDTTEEEPMTKEQRMQATVMSAVIEHRARVERSCGLLHGALAGVLCRKGHSLRDHS